MSAQSLDRLLKMPLPLPRIRTRPWWFPALELRDPLVFYLDARLADPIFGERVGVCRWPRPLSLRGRAGHPSTVVPNFEGHA